MSPVAPMMVVACAGNAMVAIVLWALSRREPGYLRLWAMAFAATALRYLAPFALAPLEQAGKLPFRATTLSSLFVTIAAVLVLAGVHRMLDRRLPRAFLVGGAAVVVWGFVADALGGSFVWRTAPPFLFVALVDVRTGIAVLRSGTPSVGRRVVGWAFIVWGLHRADFPWLGEHPVLAPWGFALATMFGSFIGMGLMLIHYDQARTSLAESEERFRSFFEHAAEGMYQSSADGRFLRVNQALVAMLGYDSKEELLAVPLPGGLYAEPGGREAVLAALGDEDVIVAHETLWKRKDGRRIRLRMNGRRVRDASGRTAYYEGAVHDVTEELALQSRLREAEKMEALGRLAGGVAHDFNNLLTAILASTDLALEVLPPRNEASEELLLVREATSQAAVLAGQLLAFSRRQPARVERADLNELLSASLPLLRRVVDESVRFELALGNGPLVVEIDAAELQQVLFNLALNARDAMPRGGRVTLCTSRDDDASRARLEVIDEGHGMDEATRARALEPFFSTKPPGRGTGLGLASAYGIVTRLGGTIALESEPGQGTTVIIELPLFEPADAEAAAPRQDVVSVPPAEGRRVLLVEDQHVVRDVLTRTLARAGFSVWCASDGEEALALLDEEMKGEPGIDLLVTDVVMPRLTGPQLLARLRERWPQLPAVLITGYSPERLDEVIEHPRSRVLIKPFQAEALLAVAQELLEPEPSTRSAVA